MACQVVALVVVRMVRDVVLWVVTLIKVDVVFVW